MEEKLSDDFTTVLNIHRETTATRHLVFDLPRVKDLKELYKNIDFGFDRWEDAKDVEYAIRIEDKVSGVVALSDGLHYLCVPN